MKPLYLILTAVILCQSLAWSQASTFIKKESSLIFPLQGLHVHGSSLVQLPNGDLLAAWFEGSGERKADDVLIKGARKKLNGPWSKTFELADTPGLPDCNPVLFLNAGDSLFLVWIAVQANAWESSLLKMRISTDYAEPGCPIWKWQDNILLKPGPEFATEVKSKLAELEPLDHGWAGYAPPYDQQIIEAAQVPHYRSFGWMTRQPPLFIDRQTLLLPLYSDGLNMSLIAISNNGGTVWEPSLPIVGRGPIQPSLGMRKNGGLTAYMRDSGDAPNFVQISTSADQGKSWSAAVKSDIPNTASVALLVHSNGTWILVGNDVHDGRQQLSLYSSSDEGRTWPSKYLIEKVASGDGQFSYPTIIESADQNIHITYSYHKLSLEKSIKHVVIDPKDL